MENNNLVWEELGLEKLGIYQDKNGYKFTADAVMLANYVSCKKTDRLAELCFGSGIISTLVSYKENPKVIYGFEVQNNVYERAKQSIEKNSLSNIEVYNCDNKNAINILGKNSLDIVICNPPYKKMQSGKVPQNYEVAVSKNEVLTTLEEITFVASQLLKSGGTFYSCLVVERLAEFFEYLQKNKLEPKEMFFSYATINSNPSCVFIKAKKDAKSGLKVLPPLITNDENGDYIYIIRNLFKNHKRKE